ncbi:hypothetical protein [Planococcus sp. CAU13]|uniref:hypothetical protein n=1 Tax=Planococcus sp. CAU13 TaxID=1541197 RepID=UPI00052FF631|nr:hypothetical protein [Planococcus sp. CAU13]
MKYHPTCSICNHFNPLTEICNYWQERQTPLNQKQPLSCVAKNVFVREMNVLLDSYHLYAPDVEVPASFRQNFSSLPKDAAGKPLFVMTKRGIERPLFIPDAPLLQADMLLGIPKIYTHQGQRELIHELGVELAQKIADQRGVTLLVQEDERSALGIPHEKRKYQHLYTRLH